MAKSSVTKILVVDADTSSAQGAALAIDSAGFAVETASFDARHNAELIARFSPQLLWVNAEMGSDTLGSLLATLERAPSPDSPPILLLCQDVRDAPFVRQMRQGIVELLQKPFSPKLHLARLRLLPMELPERSGRIRGQGTGKDLSALLSHLIRSHRTGVLTMNEGTDDAGSAYFVNGGLKKAQFRNLTMNAALAGMNSVPKGVWTFTQGADGSGALLDLDSYDSDDSFVIQRGSGDATLGGSPVRQAAVSAPAAAPVRAVAAPVELPQAPAPAPSPDASNSPVLFVDDEPALAKMFATYFSKQGYPVATAADGIEAIQKMLTARYAMVIADLNMPRLDGWGFLKAVRDDFRTSETPVALFSCHDDYREQLRTSHAGAQAFFPKSLRMNALELQVRELLEPRRRFLRLVDSGQSIEQNLSSLGPQWVLRSLAERRCTGQIDVRDNWATYRLHFTSGQLTSVQSKVGPQPQSGERALMAFLASRGLEGSMVFGTGSVESSFGGASTEELLTRVVAVMNEEHKRVREEDLKGAKALEVQPELYALYMTVGPPAWRPAVQLLCEAKLLPRDVMVRLSMAPNELAALLKDLVRRGVVQPRP